MGDHAPAVITADENVGRKGAEIGRCSRDYAGDDFNTGDAAEIALDEYVQITDLELHEVRILKDTVPAHAHSFPSD